MNIQGEKGATLSDDNKYRYALWRRWDPVLEMVMFIMLNPSTGCANKDDPTIRKCIAYAKKWGYGGILIGNVYAFRSTYPERLLQVNDPVGHYCDAYLQEMISRVNMVIASWGNKILSNERVNIIKSMTGKKLHYLELSKSGYPKHPLYLRGNLKPQKF